MRFTKEPKRELTTRLPRDRGWLRDRVVVDGGALAIERGREWAQLLGVELVTYSRPTRVTAQLVVVDAMAGHVRWRVHRAVAPLLVARASLGTGRILVAVDFADPAERVLEWVARLARGRPAEVTLVHSIEPGINAAEWMANFGGSNYEFVAADADARWNAASARLSELLARFQLRGNVRVGDRPAASFILSVADEIQADLVALGAPRHRGLLHLFLRTVASEVAASASASVLVIPHRAQLHAPE